MTYRCETTIPEIDVCIGGYGIGALIDFDCTFVLDDDGELIEVEFVGRKDHGMSQIMFFVDHQSSGVMESAIWRAAIEHHHHNRWDHIDRASVPSRGHEFADEKLPQSAFV